MFSPAQGLEARWVFPPACFLEAGDMFSLACGSEAVGMVWLPQREVWKSVVFCALRLVCLPETCLLCACPEGVWQSCPPLRVDRMRVV